MNQIFSAEKCAVFLPSPLTSLTAVDSTETENMQKQNIHAYIYAHVTFVSVYICVILLRD